MGFRFRRSFKISPGVRVNVGNHGITSTSIGGHGATLNVGGKRGARATVGLGGGLSYSTSVGSRRAASSGARTADNPAGLRSLNARQPIQWTTGKLLAGGVAAVMLLVTLVGVASRSSSASDDDRPYIHGPDVPRRSVAAVPVPIPIPTASASVEPNPAARKYSSSGGGVHVSGYTRKDGTVVHGYARRR